MNVARRDTVRDVPDSGSVTVFPGPDAAWRCCASGGTSFRTRRLAGRFSARGAAERVPSAGGRCRAVSAGGVRMPPSSRRRTGGSRRRPREPACCPVPGQFRGCWWRPVRSHPPRRCSCSCASAACGGRLRGGASAEFPYERRPSCPAEPKRRAAARARAGLFAVPYRDSSGNVGGDLYAFVVATAVTAGAPYRGSGGVRAVVSVLHGDPCTPSPRAG